MVLIIIMSTIYAENLEVGDIVFIEVPFLVFQEISKASLCWSNHVGVVVGHNGEDYILAESTIPLSRNTTLKSFIRRSRRGRYEVKRFCDGLTDNQKLTLVGGVFEKLNIPYHTGFKLHSKRQFCSKFVYELYRDRLSIELGKIEKFSDLLNTNPEASLGVWHLWFFGRIPWQRETVTPASLYFCPKLNSVAFSGLGKNVREGMVA